MVRASRSAATARRSAKKSAVKKMRSAKVISASRDAVKERPGARTSVARTMSTAIETDASQTVVTDENGAKITVARMESTAGTEIARAGREPSSRSVVSGLKHARRIVSRLRSRGTFLCARDDSLSTCVEYVWSLVMLLRCSLVMP